MMKFFLVVAITISICCHAFAQNSYKPSRGIETIDKYDSIVFDLSKAVITGDTISVPLSVKSDDEFDSFDFWFNYNHTNLLLDTVINYTTDQITYSENPTDQVVRLTANNLHNFYAHYPVKLVVYKFKMLVQPIDAGDFTLLFSLLKGIECTPVIISSGIATEIDALNNGAPLKVFPNPATENVTISVSLNKISDVNISVTDLSGRLIATIKNEKALPGKHEFNINTSSLLPGIYFVKVFSENSSDVLKLLVIK